MSEEQKPGPEADQFAADYGEGTAMAQEWIAGKGDLPDLLRIVRDMPRGVEMTGIEAGFLCTIDTEVRGALKGAARPPEPAEAKLERTPAPEAPALPAVDIEEFYRQRREREIKARLDELGRQNAAAFEEQRHAFGGGAYPRAAEWRGG